MPPPSRAKLHDRTGRLKSINKTYSSPSSNNATNRNRNQSAATSTSSSSTQTDSSSPTTANGSNNSSGSGVSSSGISDSLAIQQFELELCWCIQTMEKSLESGNLTAKQAQDTDKTIRLLKSSNQPMVKKRQIMQTAFGDYRKKMSDEEKRLRLGTRSIQFVESDADSKKDASNSGAKNTSAANKGHFVKKSLTATLGDKNFKFNFPVNEIKNLTLQNEPDNKEVDTGDSENQTATNAATPVTADKTKSTNESTEAATSTPKPSANNSKFTVSDNSFKFNFVVDCD